VSISEGTILLHFY